MEKSTAHVDQWSLGLMTGVERGKADLTTRIGLRGEIESFCAVRTGRRTGLVLNQAVWEVNLGIESAGENEAQIECAIREDPARPHGIFGSLSMRTRILPASQESGYSNCTDLGSCIVLSEYKLCVEFA